MSPTSLDHSPEWLWLLINRKPAHAFRLAQGEKEWRVKQKRETVVQAIGKRRVARTRSGTIHRAVSGGSASSRAAHRPCSRGSRGRSTKRWPEQTKTRTRPSARRLAFPGSVGLLAEFVSRVPCDVDSDTRYDEGECDRSLANWWCSPRRYFTRRGQFAENMLLYCEHFQVVERIEEAARADREGLPAKRSIRMLGFMPAPTPATMLLAVTPFVCLVPAFDGVG